MSNFANNLLAQTTAAAKNTPKIHCTRRSRKIGHSRGSIPPNERPIILAFSILAPLIPHNWAGALPQPAFALLVLSFPLWKRPCNYPRGGIFQTGRGWKNGLPKAHGHFTAFCGPLSRQMPMLKFFVQPLPIHFAKWPAADGGPAFGDNGPSPLFSLFLPQNASLCKSPIPFFYSKTMANIAFIFTPIRPPHLGAEALIGHYRRLEVPPLVAFASSDRQDFAHHHGPLPIPLAQLKLWVGSNKARLSLINVCDIAGKWQPVKVCRRSKCVSI